MGTQNSSPSQSPSLSQSHNTSAIHFPHQPSNPLLSTSTSFQLNSQSLSILAKQQLIQTNYEQQYDPLFTNFRPQSKLIYGKVRILCSKITNEKVHEYRLVFRNQQQMKVYLMSYYWRKANGVANDNEFPLVRTVNFRILQDSKQLLRGGLGGFFARNCSTRSQIFCRVYTEDIPLRLCHIKDIPFPQNLYVLKQSLHGFQIIYQNIGYIRPLQDLICISRKGQVKVWINSDLSKNFPNVQNMQSNFTQINSQSKLINQIIQLVSTNTDCEGQPCTLTIYMKQWHVNMEHITFQKVYEMLARYCMQFQVEIPEVFASIVQALNEEQQQYDTYRTEMEYEERRNGEGSGRGSNSGGGEKRSIKGNVRRESGGDSNRNSQRVNNLLNINSATSTRHLPKKRPTHIKAKTQSLNDNPQSSSSSLINNDRAKSNILLSYSMPISSNQNGQLSYHDLGGDAVVERIENQRQGNGRREGQGNGVVGVRTEKRQAASNNQYHLNKQQNLLEPQSPQVYPYPSPNFLSTNQLPTPADQYTRNKKTYSNFWQRRNHPTTTLLSSQPSSSLTNQQHSNYLITTKQQYEQMLRIDKYLQAEMLEQEYQKDKLRSIIQSSQSGGSEKNKGYYSNNEYQVHDKKLQQQHVQQQQHQEQMKKDVIQQQSQNQVQENMHGEIQKKCQNHKSSSQSQSLSALPDLHQQSNRKVVVVKDSVSINSASPKKPVPTANPHQPPLLPSPFKPSSHDSFLPSSANLPISIHSLTSNNHLSPQNIISNYNNLQSHQLTSHQTQSQFIVSNTSIGQSGQGGYQNVNVGNHHTAANHFVGQYAASSGGHSYRVFNRNNQPFELMTFKSAQFSSYDPTFENNIKPSSPIIPKITFTIHTPEISSQHHTTSLHQSLAQTNILQYSQQYFQPQHPQPNLTVSNTNCKPTQQTNFKRLAHRANTVKSHYMNSQGNQISSSRKYYQLGENESLQSKPSIVEYSLLRNPQMFKMKRHQQNMLIHETLEETNSLEKLTIDKLPTQSNRMDLMDEIEKEIFEKKIFGSVEVQQQFNGNKQYIQQKSQDPPAHTYPHNQSQPQLRHIYYQKGSQMVPIPEDVMAQTINNSRSLLMMNNFEQSINLKTIHGHKNSSHGSNNNSQILKSLHQHHLSDFGNEMLLHSYEQQPEQQLANSYHKKLQQLDDLSGDKQQQSSNPHPDQQTLKTSNKNKVNFNLNANIYTEENIIMENQISKIEQSKSHEFNINGMHISKPSFQSIQSSEAPFKQFESKQLSPKDQEQSSSKKSLRKPHYLKMIATKSISGSRVEEQGQQGRSKYRFAESIEQNSANSVYQFAMDDDILEKNVEITQFMKQHSPSEQKDISSDSQKHFSINPIPNKTILPNNENQFLDHEQSISSEMDNAYKSYEKWKRSEINKQQPSVNQYNLRKSKHKLVKSSIQGMNLPKNNHINNTQQKLQINRFTQEYCNEFGVSFQKNHSHSNFMRVAQSNNEDEIDEQILNDLKNL